MLMSNRSSNVGSDLIVVFRGTKDSVSGGAISMLYDLRKVDLLDSFKGMFSLVFKLLADVAANMDD